MNIELFNLFKKKDPKNVIVIETWLENEEPKSKAHRLYPLPNEVTTNPRLPFTLEEGGFLAVYVDTQSGPSTPPPDKYYEITYPLAWFNDPDIIEFDEVPDTGVDDYQLKRRTDKYKKDDIRKTAWHFTIKYPSKQAIKKLDDEARNRLLINNHPVEVGDNDQ